MSGAHQYGARSAAALLAMLAVTSPVFAADNAGDAGSEGDWSLAFRYRLETVDQDSFARDATASTLRSRLAYQSGERQGFSVFAELDYIAELFANDFNAGAGNTPNRTQYPVVADPDGADLNQAFVQYRQGDNRFRAGRQRIIFDNARFIGNVGWRQNEQTYDAVTFSRSGDHGLKFTLAYVDNVNRIFGNDVPDGDHAQQTYLANLGKAIEGVGTLTVYWYDIDDEDAPALANTTRGLRFTGSRPAPRGPFVYTLEFARQSENGGPVDFNANYYRLDLSAGLGAATLYGGFESLEGDRDLAGQAFRTPLATLHAFNGWADMFLATPGAGLEDAFAGLKGKAGAWTWDVLYHDFSAQSGSVDYGSELDLSLSRKLAERYVLLLKAARFDADNPAYTDTTKLWLQVSAEF